MRAALLLVSFATLPLAACFGDEGGVVDATLTVTPPPTVAAASTAAATTTPQTPTVTTTPEPTTTPSATPPIEGGAVCVNDPDRSSTVPGLLVDGEAFADDLANIRDDHAIDATRVAQVQGSTVEFSAVQLIDGPWCNEDFTWWRVEAEQAALPGDDGALDGSSRGSISGWIAEIDQFGQTNLSTDRAALGQSHES